MRLNYYVAPVGMDSTTRAAIGCDWDEADCTKYPESTTCQGCECWNGKMWEGKEGDCKFFQPTDVAKEMGGITVTRVKELMKLHGGTGYTQHIERNGGCFEVTDIKLKGNNSTFQYNQHL